MLFQECPALRILIHPAPSNDMETGSVKKVVTLFAGILVAFFIANALSNVLVVLFRLEGWTGGIVSFILYAVFFFAVLHFLQKYTHFDFFRF
jgi:hypothetical protein